MYMYMCTTHMCTHVCTTCGTCIQIIKEEKTKYYICVCVPRYYLATLVGLSGMVVAI